MHPNMRAALLDALEHCLDEKHHAAKVIQYQLKHNKKWGSRDRRFFAQTLYDIVRWRNRLAYAANLEHEEAQPMLNHWLALNGPNPAPSLLARWKDPPHLWLRYAMPQWLYCLGESEYGKAWHALCDTLNATAPLFLRANALKEQDAQSLAQALAREEIETRIRSPLCVEVLKRSNVFTTQAFKEGLFEVQDLGSQDIATFCDVEPGMRVIDACAGAGGKALHLGAIMRNKGSLIVMDIHSWKLEEFKKRAKRAGLHCYQCRLIETTKSIKRLYANSDRVLLDVPCSGSGVFRRKPDSKWKLSEAGLKQLCATQAEILDNYAKMVKTGGKMVYATCSLFKCENQAQILHFLAHHPGWTLEAERQHLPETQGSDGFYMARLLKQKA